MGRLEPDGNGGKKADGSEGVGEAGTSGSGAEDGIVDGGSGDGEMAHFAGGTGLGFAVEMEAEIGVGECGWPVGSAAGIDPDIAEEVGHGGGGTELGGAEGKPADGADLLFELAGDAGVEGEVARVVGTRGEFVDEEATVVGDEEFDGEESDDLEGVEDAMGEGLGLGGEGGRDASRGEGEVEDVMGVGVFEDWEGGEGAIGGTGGNDADFAVEGDEGFVDAFSAEELEEGVGELLWGADELLALAVVAEGGGLEDAWDAELGGGEVEVLEGVDGAEWGDGEAVLLEEGFFAEPMLGDVEDAPVWADGSDFSGGEAGGGGDILELEGDDIDLGSEAADLIEVFVGGDAFDIGDGAGWGVGIG